MSSTTTDARELRQEVSDFLRIVTISPSTFGRYAVGDPVFTHRLADQETVRITTVRKVREYMTNVLDGAKDKPKLELNDRISKALALMGEAVVAVETAKVDKPAPQPAFSPAAVELIKHVEAYLKRNPQMSETEFGAAALRHPGFLGLLRKRGTLTDETGQKVLDFMAANPNGRVVEPIRRNQPPAPVAAPPVAVRAPEVVKPVIVEPVAKPAPRPKPARVPQEPLTGSPADLGARFQEIALEDTLGDAVRVVQTAWPATWRKICQTARDQNMRPVNLMIEILEGACNG